MTYGQNKTIRSFAEIDGLEYRQSLASKIKSEIENKGKDFILGIDEEEYKKYLIDQYSLEPLTLDRDSEIMNEPSVSKEWMQDRMYQENFQRDVYLFTIKYSYIGSAVLFRIKPETWIVSSTHIVVNEHEKTVSYSFKLYKKDAAEFKREKDLNFNSAFANIENANSYAQRWNSELIGIVNSNFKFIKTKFIDENNFFAAINVKVNKDTESLFTTPTIKKKVIVQPSVAKNKEFASEPTMSKEMYEDVLKVIYDSGKSMEKKPSLYKDKDEESLRDQFLYVLETRYEGTTASGETFNLGGKTDIILKFAQDSSNLFVAECKVWHGPSEFLKAISQLFDLYLTWRDSKAALMLFVKNKDFTHVLKAIQSEVKNHPYFVKEVGSRGETSFSYIFRLAQDKDKHVYFEIMAFHYDK